MILTDYIVVEACNCLPYQLEGTCTIPWRARARDRKTFGWWCGAGETIAEAMSDAMMKERNANAI